jgi:addiction module HigA family antidote
LDEEVEIVTQRVASYSKSMKVPIAKPIVEEINRIVTLFRELRSGVSAEMALRLGTLLGNGAQLWLDMQTQHDLWQAEAKLHDELGRMKPLAPLAA